MLKAHQYEYPMKGLDLGNKIMLFIFNFCVVFLFNDLFMFYGCKQTAQFVYIFKNAKRSSIWVSNERSRL